MYAGPAPEPGQPGPASSRLANSATVLENLCQVHCDPAENLLIWTTEQVRHDFSFLKGARREKNHFCFKCLEQALVHQLEYWTEPRIYSERLIESLRQLPHPAKSQQLFRVQSRYDHRQKTKLLPPLVTLLNNNWLSWNFRCSSFSALVQICIFDLLGWWHMLKAIKFMPIKSGLWTPFSQKWLVQSRFHFHLTRSHMYSLYRL